MSSHPQQEFLDAPIPERWGFIQRAKNTILYYLIRFFFWLISLTPFIAAKLFGVLLGYLAYWLVFTERNKALSQLAIAFPEKSQAQREILAKRMFVHLGIACAEVTHIPTLLKRDDLKLNSSHRAIFDEALKEGKGCIAVTGHIGNWELLAQVLAANNIPIHTIAKPVYDPRLTRWAHSNRTQFGLNVIWRGQRGGFKEMLRVFHQKEALALLIDQDTNVQSVFVPFFGKAAATPAAVGVLASRTKAPIIVGWLQRENNGYQLSFERFEYQLSGEKTTDIQAITAGVTQRLEWAIRQAPEQWVWMHHRWKTRPPRKNNKGE